MCSIDSNCVFNNSHKNNVDMKTNAPERLYLSKTIYSTYLYQVPDPDDESAVEYTRTDAFIEKAEEYLSYHLDTSKIDVYYKFDFIEEFKKAMML